MRPQNRLVSLLGLMRVSDGSSVSAEGWDTNSVCVTPTTGDIFLEVPYLDAVGIDQRTIVGSVGLNAIWDTPVMSVANSRSTCRH